MKIKIPGLILLLISLGALSASLVFTADGADRNTGEYPRLSKSAFWLPYEPDSATKALFHLDEAAAKKIVPDLDTMSNEPADKNAEGLLDKGEDSEDGAFAAGLKRAANAVGVGNSAVLLGDAVFVPEARLNGGLKLGGAGALAAAKLSNVAMVEAWMRIDKLPPEPSIIMAASPEAKPYLWQILLKPDGVIELEWSGKATGWPGVRIEQGTWTHFAFGITSAWPEGNAVHFLVNGKAVKPLKQDNTAAAVRSAETVWIGGDREAKRAITGCVDEVRVSSALRYYYSYDLGWPKPERQVEFNPGQPFFRDKADLLFRAGFNKSLKPEPCSGSTSFKEHAITKADEELAPEKVNKLYPLGVEGNAIMLGQGSLSPVYMGAGNLAASSGTIAFWLQPLDWDNLTRDNRFDKINPTSFGIFQIDGEYAEGSYDRNFGKAGPLVEFNVVMHMDEGVENPVEFAPGRWTHIAMTWEGTSFKYFVDGIPRDPDGAWNLWLPIYPGHDPRNPPKPEWWLNSKPLAIRFGERRYWDQLKLPAPHSAIDDFRVYGRSLSPSEVLNLARLYDPRSKPEALPAVEMAMTYNGVSGLVTAELTPLMPEYANSSEALLQVFKVGDTKPAGSATSKLDERKQARVEVATGPMDFADYKVKAEVRDSTGKTLGTAEKSFSRKPPAWWKNKLGVSEKVMPDWSPIAVRGNTIKVAEREIIFAPSGLPERIVSCGADILAAPVSLEAASGGKAIELASPRPAETKPMGEVRAEAKGKLSGGGLDISIESYAEFDGMIWFTAKLSTAAEGKPAVIDALTLRIPIKPESADFIHWWSGERDFRNPKVVHIGTLPDKKGVIFRSNDSGALTRPEELRGSFIPYLLLTGDRCGLAWFAENDNGWTLSDEIPAVSVERDDKSVTLVLRIIGGPVKIDAVRSFAFGLQPTPVKTLDPLWRQYQRPWNVFPDTFCGNNLKGRKGPSTFYLYPEDDWEAVKRRINGEGLTKGAAGLKGLNAGQLKRLADAGISNPPPQTITVPGLYWDMQWNGITPSLEDTREWAETWALNYQFYTPEFVDFCSWAWNDWIVKTDKFVQGAYIDDCWGAPITREGGPCTYKLPDGHVQPGFQFLGPRERFKRMRQISWDLGVWPHIPAHSTHTFFIPYHAFFDIVLDGEDFYSSPPNQDDFIDHWPLDRMRFMHNAKWGLVTTWLAWCGNSCPVDKYPAWTFRQTRAYTANIALHDIGWGFDEKLLKEFGLKEADTVFIPYWEDGGFVKENSHPDAVKVSAWRRGGKHLILVANVGRDRAEATIRLNLPASAAVRDVDPELLTYFKEDITNIQKPDMKDKADGVGEIKDAPAGDEEISLDVSDSDLAPEERRLNDPDGKFAWKDGVLSCPVRRHDYRLFLAR